MRSCVGPHLGGEKNYFIGHWRVLCVAECTIHLLENVGWCAFELNLITSLAAPLGPSGAGRAKRLGHSGARWLRRWRPFWRKPGGGKWIWWYRLESSSRLATLCLVCGSLVQSGLVVVMVVSSLLVQ